MNEFIRRRRRSAVAQSSTDCKRYGYGFDPHWEELILFINNIFPRSGNKAVSSATKIRLKLGNGFIALRSLELTTSICGIQCEAQKNKFICNFAANQ